MRLKERINSAEKFLWFILLKASHILKLNNHICLKLADVTPLYKLEKKNHEENYRPVSILPNYLKFFLIHISL